MAAAFNGRGMIPVFPKGSFTVSPLIILLAGPPGYELHGLGNDLMIVIDGNQKMDMIGGDHIIQNGQSKSLPGFREPAQSALTVFGKFQ